MTAPAYRCSAPGCAALAFTGFLRRDGGWDRFCKAHADEGRAAFEARKRELPLPLPPEAREGRRRA